MARVTPAEQVWSPATGCFLFCVRQPATFFRSLSLPPFLHHRTATWRRASLVGLTLPTERGPAWGLVGETLGSSAHVAVKWPFEDFWNRDSLPFTVISRVMAAKSVACGVLPPGLVHNPFDAIASIRDLPASS